MRPLRLEIPPRTEPLTPQKTRSGNNFSGFPNFGNLAIFLDEEFAFKCDSELSRDDPTSIKDLEKRSDKQLWLEAMQDELNSMHRNLTWTLVDLPFGKKAIQNKWVLKTKFDAAGNLVKRKARLVAKGFTQRYGIDYDETFSPVARYTSIRTLIAIAVQRKMHIHQMDAVTAFLQGELSENIYMMQPDGFHDGTNRVCKLNKSIYGLKQAGRVWNIKLDDMLQKFGLTRSLNDQCLYISPTADLIIAVYVDDFLILYDDSNVLEKLKRALTSSFHMKDLGRATSIIGMRINYVGDSIALDQTVYVEEVLKRFGMEDSKPVALPAESHSAIDQDDDVESDVPYQEAVGSLIYLAHATRPDIAFAVNKAAQFNSKHNAAHWKAVKKIFRYLRGTTKFNLVFSPTRSPELIGYSDSDHGSDPSDRKSQTGYVFMLSNGAISWKSTKQKIIALSSTEAEFIALTSTMQEAIWIKQLLAELQFEIGTPLLRCDNTSTIKIALHNNYSPRTKHIDIRVKCLVQKLANEEFLVEHVSTNQNAADFFTKSVSKEKHQLFVSMTGIKDDN